MPRVGLFFFVEEDTYDSCPACGQEFDHTGYLVSHPDTGDFLCSECYRGTPIDEDGDDERYSTPPWRGLTEDMRPRYHDHYGGHQADNVLATQWYVSVFCSATPMGMFGAEGLTDVVNLWRRHNDPNLVVEDVSPRAIYSEGIVTAAQHYEEPDDGDVPDAEHRSVLSLPVLDGREPRLMSFELEIGRGSNREGITASLCAAGLSPHIGVQRYTYSGADHTVFVKTDASTGGEIVFSKFRFDRFGEAFSAEQAARHVRDAVKAGSINIDRKSGFHVHVGANGLSIDDTVRLVMLSRGVEDPLMRLASAFWGMHRSETGNAYGDPIPHHPLTDSKRRFLAIQAGSRCAVNIKPYFSAMQDHCSCGASRFGEWEACECGTALLKPTIEFRLFCGTANLRKMRAYLALSLGLVSLAQREGLKFPDPMPYQGKTGVLDESIHDASYERLRWLMVNLPLTDEEREDLLYVARNCSLNDIGLNKNGHRIGKRKSLVAA